MREINTNTNVWEKHHPKALEMALRLREEGQSWSSIAATLSDRFGDLFTYDAVVSKLRKVWGKKKKRRRHAEPAPAGRKTYVIFSDIHLPFEVPELNQKVKEQSGKDRVLILAGDLFDLYCCSKFVQDKDVALKDELISGYNYLKQWSEWYQEIIVFLGNHEDRLHSYLAGRVDPAVGFLFDSNILHTFTKGVVFTYRSVGGEQSYTISPIQNLKVVDSWWIEIGDAIIAHPKSFSRVDGKTVVETDGYFTRRGHQHRVVIIGHTHQLASIVSCGKLLMEIGCNCREMDYALKGKVSYKPQVNAFALLVQDNGVTDFNNTRSILY